MIDTIVYHGNCPDGFCAAFVAHLINPDATLVPATHGSTPRDKVFAGKHVLVVDFSWKRAEMERIKALTASLVVLDHHKTAEAELDGLDYCTFDMTRSGAQLAWDYFYPGYPRPWYVEYVADRDLWLWQLPDSKCISAYIMAQPHTVDAWTAMSLLKKSDVLERGIGAAAHVAHYVEKVAAEAQPGVYTELQPDNSVLNRKVSIVNAAYPNISDVLGELNARGAEVAMGWFIRGDGLMQFSLRSVGDLDVSKIAVAYGGGGHRNAAGFQLPVATGMLLLGGLFQR